MEMQWRIANRCKGIIGLRRKWRKGVSESLLKQGDGKRIRNEHGWKEHGKQEGRITNDDKQRYDTTCL